MSRVLLRGMSLGTNAALLAAAFLVSGQGEAYAYLDPGTGSILFQAVAGTVLASLFAVKMFWRRIQAFVALNVLQRKPEHTDDDPD